MNTRAKMLALSNELRTMSAEDASPESRQMLELVQIAAGFGVDVFAWLIPDTDAEADLFVDQLIGLFLRLRGDDLPPISPTQYGEHPEPITSGNAAPAEEAVHDAGETAVERFSDE